MAVVKQVAPGLLHLDRLPPAAYHDKYLILQADFKAAVRPSESGGNGTRLADTLNVVPSDPSSTRHRHLRHHHPHHRRSRRQG